MSRTLRFAYRLAMFVGFLLVLFAWTQLPDCWQPGVCG